MNPNDKKPTEGFRYGRLLKLGTGMPMKSLKDMTKQNVPVEISLDHAPDYLVARSVVPFAHETSMEIFKTVLAALSQTGCHGALIDATAITEPVSTSAKLMITVEAHDHLTVFRQIHDRFPKIAIWALAPFCEDAELADEYMEKAGVPMRTFLDRQKAVDWLSAQ